MRAATVALAGVLAATLLLAPADGATARPTLRVGFVTWSGITPSSRDLFGLPLFAYLQAAKQFHLEPRVLFVAPNEDLTAPLETLAREKYDLVVSGAPGTEAVFEVAKRFPHVRFLMPDTSVEDLRRRLPNVRGTVFRAEEAGYLAGYLAALMEARRPGRHVVSAVGGDPGRVVDRWITGFNAGATRADPGVTHLVDYSHDFGDQDKCRTVARGQIARGSGVVFNVAGACGLGAIDVAGRHRVWAVGVDVDQAFLGDQVLTSAVSHYDRPIADAIRALVRGSFTTGADGVYDLRNGGVGLGRISPSVPAPLLRRVSEVRRGIVAGRIAVPHVTRT